MNDLFAVCLQSGLFGSVIIVMILLLRQYLKQAPRKYLCILWLLAAMRLLLPFQLESHLSLQPRYDAPEFTAGVEETVLSPDALPQWTPVEPESDAVPDQGQAISAPVDPMGILSVVWLTVGGCLLVYAVVSYGYLKFKVRDAVKIDSGIMESDRIRGAFLLGYFKPRIYIPLGLRERDRNFMIAHERAHLARGDNWWKLAGFLCCCVHWYNPLVWLGYGLQCRDIEIACDERVVRNMDLDQRKEYSFVLLNCGKQLSGFLAYPVAFGKVSLKQRIKNVLSYRRPGLWITVIAVVLVIFMAVCFLTTPVMQPTQTEPAVTTVPTEVPDTLNAPTDTFGTVPVRQPETDSGTEPTTDPATKPTTKPANVLTAPPTEPPTTTPTEPVTTPTESPATPPTEPPATDPEETLGDGMTVIAEGKWDSGPVTWRVTSDGTLTISGNTYIQGANTYIWKEYADIITKIVVEDGIIGIPQYAFSDMPNVTTVYLGKKLNRIEKYAFANCTSLQSISIPAQVGEIKEYTFYGCTSLHTLKFAKYCQVQTIEKYAFAKTGITSFVWPDSLSSMDRSALSGCNALQYYESPDAKYWGSSLCEGDGFLTGDGIEGVEIYSINVHGFEDLKGLKTVVIGGDATVIHNNMFSGCTALSSVTINAPVTEIEMSAFFNCVSLTSITLPNTVIKIGISAFAGSGITSITIPASVQEMGWSVFKDSGLCEIVFEGDAPLFSNKATFKYITATAYYPADNPTWTEDKLQDYGGTITWVSI